MRKVEFPYIIKKDEEKNLMIVEAKNLREVVLMSPYSRYRGKDKIEVPLFKGKIRLVTTNNTYMYLSTVDKAVPTVSIPAPEVTEEITSEVETQETDSAPEVTEEVTSEVVTEVTEEVTSEVESTSDSSANQVKSGKKKK